MKPINKMLVGLFALSLISATIIVATPQSSQAAPPPLGQYSLLAAGQRSSVLTVTGEHGTTSHNGSQWYYNEQSMGFAPAGATIYQNSADIQASNIFDDEDETTPYRLSWHTSATNINSGWRIGGTTHLNDGTPNAHLYTRAIYTADTQPSYYPSGPQLNVPFENLEGWTLCYEFTYADTAVLADVWEDCDGEYLLYAAGDDSLNKIDAQRNGTSVLDTPGGEQTLEILPGQTITPRLYNASGDIQINWSHFRVYVGCLVADMECNPTSPLTDSEAWTSYEYVNGSFVVKESWRGKYIALVSVDSTSREPVGGSWTLLAVADKDMTTDTDKDGIDDEIENNGPNGGDANNDGILDSEQRNVASFLSPITKQYVVIETSEGCIITSAEITKAESFDIKDAGYEYPLGFAAFSSSCEVDTVKVIVKFFNLENDNFTARKHNPNTGAFFTIEDAEISQGELDGLKFVSTSYIIVDGGDLDTDGEANGIIVDPFGLGQQIVGAPRTGGGGTA